MSRASLLILRAASRHGTPAVARVILQISVPLRPRRQGHVTPQRPHGSPHLGVSNPAIPVHPRFGGRYADENSKLHRHVKKEMG